MAKRLSCAIVLLGCIAAGCSLEGGGGGESPEPGRQAVNPDAKVLQDFKSRVDKYVEMRKELKKQTPPLEETKDPARIQAAQEGLAEKIRAARKEAKPGDIFTPDVKALFRRLMYPEIKGRDGEATKETIKEDAPKGVPLKVNASYPDSAPLPTVPPNLLAALPKLPEDLEFRFINRDMILLDVEANLIVDYIQNALR
jgi:hypothetical protein